MSDPDPVLHHVVLVGGSTDAWAAMPDGQWDDLLAGLGAVVARAGGRWLTVRPYGADTGEGARARATTAPAPAAHVAKQRVATVGCCTVTADPEDDGRERLATAAESLRAAGTVIDESSLARVLDAPAEEPTDLVVVLGPDDRLPPSLVWELAYSELVFLPRTWPSVAPEDVAVAIESFARRHRRFGGVD